MLNGETSLAIAQVGFTGSDADRERLVAMSLWLERNDPAFAMTLQAARGCGTVTEDCYDLSTDPPRDFLAEDHRADIVVMHNLWGFANIGRRSGATAVSPCHSHSTWNRRLELTRARYIFVFGGDFSVAPAQYERIDEPSLYYLVVWTKNEMRCRKAISCRDLAQERLRRLGELAKNKFLDLSHVSSISRDHLTAIASMPNLRELLLSGIASEDVEIAAMLAAGCHALQILHLDGTLAGEATLRALRSRSELATLSLNDTGISGAALKHLRQLPNLKVLSLANTNVDDLDVRVLLRLRNLRLLNLTGARVGDHGIGQLARELPDCVIET